MTYNRFLSYKYFIGIDIQEMVNCDKKKKIYDNKYYTNSDKIVKLCQVVLNVISPTLYIMQKVYFVYF